MAIQIDVRENEAFESGWFVATVIAVIFMAVAVLAGLSGALGGGPLAKAMATVPGRPVLIGYERFVRTQTPSRLDLTIASDLGRDTAEVHLDRRFLDRRDIKDVLPKPNATRVDADGVTYIFALGIEHHGEISFWLTPNAAGPAGGSIAVDGDAAPIHQFIYP